MSKNDNKDPQQIINGVPAPESEEQKRERLKLEKAIKESDSGLDIVGDISSDRGLPSDQHLSTLSDLHEEEKRKGQPESAYAKARKFNSVFSDHDVYDGHESLNMALLQKEEEKKALEQKREDYEIPAASPKPSAYTSSASASSLAPPKASVKPGVREF